MRSDVWKPLTAQAWHTRTGHIVYMRRRGLQNTYTSAVAFWVCTPAYPPPPTPSPPPRPVEAKRRTGQTFSVEISVSSLIFHGSRPSETLCISSLWPETSKQEQKKTAWIWPYTSFNSCEYQQFAFSDPHWALLLLQCWLQCCWKRNVNFCKRTFYYKWGLISVLSNY